MEGRGRHEHAAPTGVHTSAGLVSKINMSECAECHDPSGDRRASKASTAPPGSWTCAWQFQAACVGVKGMKAAGHRVKCPDIREVGLNKPASTSICCKVAQHCHCLHASKLLPRPPVEEAAGSLNQRTRGVDVVPRKVVQQALQLHQEQGRGKGVWRQGGKEQGVQCARLSVQHNAPATCQLVCSPIPQPAGSSTNSPQPTMEKAAPCGNMRNLHSSPM